MPLQHRTHASYLLHAAVAAAATGCVLGLATWVITFRDAMHARSLLVFLLGLGGVAGGIAGLIPGMAGAIASLRGLRIPSPEAWGVGWSIAGSISLAVFLETSVRAGGLPGRRWLVVALAPLSVAAAAVIALMLAALLERGAGRLGHDPARFLHAGMASFLLTAAFVMAVLTLVPADHALRAGPSRAGGGEAAGRPDIVLISLDTVRPDHLSAHGYPRPTTPNVDRLIAEGATFTQAIASSSWTIPSHASLMTGASPSRIAPEMVAPPQSGRVALPEEAVTLAEVLGSRGYETAAFIGGATMRSTMGFAQGFDYFDDLLPPSAPALSDHIFFASRARALMGVGRNLFLAWADPALLALSNRIYGQRHAPPTGAYTRHSRHPRRFWSSAAEVNAKVDAWLDRPDASPRRPWFLFVHYFDVHDPYDAPEPWAGRWTGDIGDLGFITDTGLLREVMREKRVLTRGEIEGLTGAYDEEIAAVDARLGDLISMLRERGLSDDAMVVLFSDHGESLGDHNDLFHGHALHEELIRIVLAIRAPGRVAAGTRVDRQVRAVDIAPTLLDLAGLAGGEAGLRLTTTEGVSLVPLLADPGADFARTRTAFSEVHGRALLDPFGPFRVEHVGVREDGWKYVRSSDGSRALHDLSIDPGETTNLADGRPDRARELGERLDGWIAGGYIGTTPAPDVDPRRLEELRGLGYIEEPRPINRSP